MKTKKTNNRCALHSLDSRGSLDIKNKIHNRQRNKQIAAGDVNGDVNVANDNLQLASGNSTSYLSDGGIMKSTVGSLGYAKCSLTSQNEKLDI